MLTRRHAALAVVLLLVAGAAGLVAVELEAGALGYGREPVADPCEPRPQYPGKGIDATIQRVALNGLDGAACGLRTSREELVLSFVPETGTTQIEWDRETIETAVRSGLERSIEEAENDGSLGPLAAFGLRALVRIAPIDWLIDGGRRLAELF